MSCPPGSHFDDTIPVQEGISKGGAGSCTLCSPGQYLAAAPDSKFTLPSDNHQCKLCVSSSIGTPGSYQAQQGQTSCSQCPIGYFQTFDGQDHCTKLTADIQIFQVSCGAQCSSSTPIANWFLSVVLLVSSLFYTVQMIRYLDQAEQLWLSWLKQISAGAYRMYGYDLGDSIGALHEPIAESFKAHQVVFKEIHRSEAEGLAAVQALPSERPIAEVVQPACCSNPLVLEQCGVMAQQLLKILVEPRYPTFVTWTPAPQQSSANSLLVLTPSASATPTPTPSQLGLSEPGAIGTVVATAVLASPDSTSHSLELSSPISSRNTSGVSKTDSGAYTVPNRDASKTNGLLTHPSGLHWCHAAVDPGVKTREAIKRKARATCHGEFRGVLDVSRLSLQFNSCEELAKAVPVLRGMVEKLGGQIVQLENGKFGSWAKLCRPHSPRRGGPGPQRSRDPP